MGGRVIVVLLCLGGHEEGVQLAFRRIIIWKRSFEGGVISGGGLVAETPSDK